MSFARMVWFGFEGPLQAHIYDVRRALDPNLLGYLLVGPLIPLVGADRAEILLQATCLLGLPAAGLFALRGLRAPGAGWIILVVPIALSEPFFLGLYNYILSLSAALIAFGMLLRAERGCRRSWIGFSLALIAAFLAHAGGLIAGLMLALAWLVPRIILDLTSRTSWQILIRRYGPAALAMLPALLLIAQFAFRQAHSDVQRGIGLTGRLMQLLGLTILATNGTATVILAQGVSLLIIICTVTAVMARVRSWRRDASSRLDTIRFALMIALGFALVVAFPDVAGGGWTHVRRMIPLAYLPAVLLCAAHDWPARSRGIICVVGSVLTFGLVASAVHEQALVHTVTKDVDRLLALVADHCTVLPIIPVPYLETDFRPFPMLSPLYASGSRTSYAPLAHVATRVEQRGDRVSLYNFLARLSVYPIANKPGIDPARDIFHWAPHYREGAVEIADVVNFERATGMHVDYLLTQHDPMERDPQLRATAGVYRLIDTGEIGLRLYRRAAEAAVTAPYDRTPCATR